MVKKLTTFFLLCYTCLLVSSCVEEDGEKTIENHDIYYEKICIEGHVYFDRYKQLSIKLDDEGKPIKCR